MPAGNHKGIEFQPRDLLLFRGLFESRVMTLAHATVLYFDGKNEMAKKRLQKLKAAGIVRERPRHFSNPSVLFLTRKAFKLLRNHGHLTDYPSASIAEMDRRAQVSELTLRHELEVMDVKTAMVKAINATATHRVAEFSTWPKLYEFKACRPNGERATVKPDGFICIRETKAHGGHSEHNFFLEVDRSTESLDVLAERCHCYADFYRSGGFAVRNGASADAFKEYPFRILLVCKSEKRRVNIAKRILSGGRPIRTQVMLATKNDAVLMPQGQIWMQPGIWLPPQNVARLGNVSHRKLRSLFG
jgi:hypothetical protein